VTDHVDHLDPTHLASEAAAAVSDLTGLARHDVALVMGSGWLPAADALGTPDAEFAAALRAFDAALPTLLAALREDDLLFITADHGNDPTTASTDHARERVPLLACGRAVRPGPLGERATFADLGATVAEWLGVEFRGAGGSFLGQLTARAAAPAAGAGA